MLLNISASGRATMNRWTTTFTENLKDMGKAWGLNFPFLLSTVF